MAEKAEENVSLPTTLIYTPETHTLTEVDTLTVGPADLVFFQSVVPAAKHTTYTFVVLRRVNE